MAQALSRLHGSTGKGAGGLRSRLVLQPDIDIVLKHEDGRLCAIEVKWFPRNAQRRAFHEGLGQALALLGYGFDSAALWPVFQDDDVLRRYGSRAWFLVRNQLKLPLDFTPLVRCRGSDGRPEYAVWQYEGPTDCHDTGKTIASAPTVFAQGNRNPLLSSEPAKTLRTHLDGWFGNPDRERKLLPTAHGKTPAPKDATVEVASPPHAPTGGLLGRSKNAETRR